MCTLFYARFLALTISRLPSMPSSPRPLVSIASLLSELEWAIASPNNPVLPFLVFLEKGKPSKKQGFFIPTEPLKSLEKKGKTLKKTRKSSQGKKTRNSKKTRKGRRGKGQAKRRCHEEQSARSKGARLSSLDFCTGGSFRKGVRVLRFPRPQTGPRIPISCKRGFRGPKTPISPRPHTTWKREFSVKKSPFSLCSLVEKRGFFDRKPPFPEMGVFGPQNPLFQEMGIRGPVWGRGNRNASSYWCPWGSRVQGGGGAVFLWQ